MTAPANWGTVEAVLFDLDGTLIDSAPDIAAAVNELLSAHDLPELEVPQVRSMIGHGVSKLVERAFAASGMPLSGEVLEAEISRMMGIYGEHLTRLTTVYPGALEALQYCALMRIKTAIVSNKPRPFTDAIALHYGFSQWADALQGAEDHIPKKPAPDMLFAALDKAGAARERAIMVGDSIADVEAARAASLPVVLIRGGYTTTPVEQLGADRVLDSLADLPTLLQRAEQVA